MAPHRSFQKAIALVLMLNSALAADPVSASQLECACTSTHFADVSFSVKCWRNSTGEWPEPLFTDASNTYHERSKILCSRGLRPPVRIDYRLVPNVGHYKFHPRQTTWEDALRSCAAEGANLAVVNSAAEAAAMAAIFKEFPKLNQNDWQNDQAWIGATDLKTEGVYLSLRGLTLEQEGWETWEKGEPNNEGDGEHCAVFNRDQQLTDEPCSTKFSFFCERPI